MLKSQGEKELELEQKKVKKSTQKKLTLAILKPGRYLMLNQNKYINISFPSSVLLLNEEFSSHSIALLEEELILVKSNEYQV